MCFHYDTHVYARFALWRYGLCGACGGVYAVTMCLTTALSTMSLCAYGAIQGVQFSTNNCKITKNHSVFAKKIVSMTTYRRRAESWHRRGEKGDNLGYVVILVWVVFITFHIVSVNKTFYSLLQIGRLKCKIHRF